MLYMARADQANGKCLLVRAEAVAILCGVSVRKISDWANDGVLPKPVCVPGPRRWTRKSIEEWIADGCPPRRASKRQ
jgi:predicted DNA-binding transcriptional regulator AlpA